MITAERLARRAWVETVMGMPVSVHVRAVEPTRPDLEAGVARVFAHLRRVDAVLSTWRADSDLLRLQHGEVDEGHAWVADVTELCLEAEDRTDGLFRAWRRRAGGRLTFDPTGLVKGWAVAGAAAHLDVVPEISWSVGAGGDVLVGAGRGMGTARSAVADRRRGPAPRWRRRRGGDAGPRRGGDVGRGSTWGACRGSGYGTGHLARGVMHGRRPRPPVGRRVGHCGLGGCRPRRRADGSARPRIPPAGALTRHAGTTCENPARTRENSRTDGSCGRGAPRWYPARTQSSFSRGA